MQELLFAIAAAATILSFILEVIREIKRWRYDSKKKSLEENNEEAETE